MNNKFKTKEGWKTGENLSFEETLSHSKVHSLESVLDIII
jgi:hypothetical protein